MKLFRDHTLLQTHLDGLDPKTTAPISRQTPLLSNLDIIENIALIKEVHERMPRRNAHGAAQMALDTLGYGRIAHTRPAACTVDERFAAQVIRASMLQNATMVIINPFVMLDDSKPIEWIADLLLRLDVAATALILDVNINRPKYAAGGKRCSMIE